MSWWIYPPGDEADGMSVTYNIAGIFDKALGLPERLDWNEDGSPRMCSRPQRDEHGEVIRDSDGKSVWIHEQSTIFGIRLLDEAPATEAHGVIRRAIERMEADMPSYREMNPANGWGDADGALDVLKTLLRGCEECPDGKVMVH